MGSNALLPAPLAPPPAVPLPVLPLPLPVPAPSPLALTAPLESPVSAFLNSTSPTAMFGSHFMPDRSGSPVASQPARFTFDLPASSSDAQPSSVGSLTFASSTAAQSAAALWSESRSSRSFTAPSDKASPHVTVHPASARGRKDASPSGRSTAPSHEPVMLSRRPSAGLSLSAGHAAPARMGPPPSFGEWLASPAGASAAANAGLTSNPWQGSPLSKPALVLSPAQTLQAQAQLQMQSTEEALARLSMDRQQLQLALASRPRNEASHQKLIDMSRRLHEEV